MSNFENTIDLIGDEAVVKAIVEKSITEFHDDVVKTIGYSAFVNCTLLASIDLPNVSLISNFAFQQCSSLLTADFPNVTSVNQNAFENCSNLETVNFPKLGNISSQNIFRGCKKLTAVHMPEMKSISYSNTFDGCTSLETISLPKLTTLGNSTFQNCTAFTRVDFPLVRSIGTAAFSGCTVFKTLILRNSTLCTLSNTNAFTGTPFASGGTGGTLLAPSSLVESYKTATNWSVIWGYGHNRFLALEDYTVDGTLTGAIDWDKLNGGTT